MTFLCNTRGVLTYTILYIYTWMYIYIFIEILAGSVKPVLRAIVFLTLSRPRASQIRGRVRLDRRHGRLDFIYFVRIGSL